MASRHRVVAAAALAACAVASFVPLKPQTMWLELSALRRPEFPFVFINMPQKTLFASLALNESCGYIPALRDAGCFPAALNWLYSQWHLDRTDYYLRMSGTNSFVSKETAMAAPIRTVFAGTAAPWEVLLARADVYLDENTWLAKPETKVSLTVDTIPNWNRATSPVVVAESFTSQTQYEYLFGLIHASADSRMDYPTQTALQYIFNNPSTTLFAALVNATCFCPDDWDKCPESYLCVVLDQAVFTWFVPVDSAFSLLTTETVDYLFANSSAASFTIAYHMLGPLMFTANSPYTAVPERRRALNSAEIPAAPASVAAVLKSAREAIGTSRSTGDSVNRRLARLSNHLAAREAAQLAAVEAVIRESRTQAPQEQSRKLSLGEAGKQTLGFGPDDFPFDLDDVLLWTDVAPFVPFNSYTYLAQFIDVLNVNGTAVVETFAPLFNISACVEANYTLTRLRALGLSQFFNEDEEHMRNRGEEEIGYVPHEEVDWRAIRFLERACKAFIPAELFLTLGSAFPCRSACEECQSCQTACTKCQLAGGGRRAWDCTSACACSDTCGSCTGCLSLHPPPYGPYRRAWATTTPSYPQITLTCIDPLCGVIDTACTATTTSEYDIETLNALIHTIDNVLLPPSVILTLQALQIQPYYASPACSSVSPNMACPYYQAINETLYDGLFPSSSCTEL